MDTRINGFMNAKVEKDIVYQTQATVYCYFLTLYFYLQAS